MQGSERKEVPFRHSLRARLLVGLLLALAMMLAAVRKMLSDLGVEPENVAFDDFGG